MGNMLATVAIVVGVINAMMLIVLIMRKTHGVRGELEAVVERAERGLREEIGRSREESATAARALREELSRSLTGFLDSVLARMTEIATLQKNQLDMFAASLAALTESNAQKLEMIRDAVERRLGQLAADAGQNQAAGREEMSKSIKSLADSILARMTEIATLQKNQLDVFGASLNTLTASNEQKLEQLRATVEGKLGELQADNSQKLEQMRATVDEKLHATLEQRLGESFKIVSERLDVVSQGLGEMKSLASGVGDLKKVLTNIKTRGCFGEAQLGNLLEQMLTADQYAANVATNPHSAERVDFAIKFPGADGTGKPVWLPIDAKFPQEDFQRLVDAQEIGDTAAVQTAALALEGRVWGEARKIKEKYINPPHTLDLAILFLPIEGLFAEVLRRPGLFDGIMHEHRVLITGPTTLAAVLTALQMGFRTLAIQKRSSEVWQVLSAVKTEFSKFGEVLDKVGKKLAEASNTVETAVTRSRAVERKLRDVESLPADEAKRLLGGLDDSVVGLGGETDRLL